MLRLLSGDDQMLRHVARMIGPKITKAQHRLISKVHKTLLAIPGALAIAAPQVGIDLRFFVALRTASEAVTVINPRVTWTSLDEIDDFFVDPQGNPIARQSPAWEGCLSFPKMEFLVVRPNIIKVEFLTDKGVTKTTSLNGFDARLFLHELDHLDGIMVDSKCQSSRQMDEAEEDRMSM